MRYRIEYAFGGYCSFAKSSKDLIEELKRLKRDMVVDVRKLYKSGVSDSVMDVYEKYLRR